MELKKWHTIQNSKEFPVGMDETEERKIRMSRLGQLHRKILSNPKAAKSAG